MDDFFKNKYYNDTFRLIRMMVVKFEGSAFINNVYLSNLNGSSYVDQYDKSTWKYYLNLNGEYHKSDDLMYVTSPYSNSNDKVLFNKNLVSDLNIKSLFGLGSRGYLDLLNRYPLQERLINGILNPVDINTAISSPDYTILFYPRELVESQEVSLISELQQFIYNFQSNRNNDSYRLTDSLYYSAQISILIMACTAKIFNLRLKRIRTNEVHSFHIRQFLASHQGLDKYIDYLNLQQKIYLYRNLIELEHNSGKTRSFNQMIKRLLTDIGIPLNQFNFNQTLEFDADLIVGSKFNPKSLNNINDGLYDRPLSLNNILQLESNLTVGNKNEIDIAKQEIKQSLDLSPSAILKTKILYSNRINKHGVLPFSRLEIIMNNWSYLAMTDVIPQPLILSHNLFTETLIISHKNAYILMLYILRNYVMKNNTPIKHFYFNRIVKQDVDTNQLLNLVDKNKITIGEINELKQLIPIIPTTINTTSLANYHEQLYQTTLNFYLLTGNQDDMNVRAYYEYIINSFYTSQHIVLDPPIDLDTWMQENNIPVLDIDVTTALELIFYIFSKATGFQEDSGVSDFNKQKTVIEIVKLLSSYTLQFISDEVLHETTPLVNKNTRYNNFKYDGLYKGLISLTTEINYTLSKELQIKSDITSPLSPIKSSKQIKTQQDLENYTKLKNFLINRYGYELSSMSVSFEHRLEDGSIETLEQSVIGYANFMSFPYEQRKQYLD